MDNKKLGIIIVIISILIALVFLSFKIQLTETAEAGCGCVAGTCPMEETLPLATYGGIALIFAILSLGLYLIFFERSQKEIIGTLKEVKKKESDKERFDLLLSTLNEDEKKVIKAVKEQDGITQATLRIRTDFSKSKLSAILSGLEKRNLIKKVIKGKTNQIFLKKVL